MKEHGGSKIRGDAKEASNESISAEHEGHAHSKDAAQDQRDAKKMDKVMKQDRRC